jgi:hypothetical protein
MTSYLDFPKLPLGLEYHFSGEAGLCVNCGGLVQDYEPLIRRSKYRNRVFEQEFSASNGVCLKCTLILMTNIVARFFYAAENSIKNYNELEQNNKGDEDTENKLDVYEQAIEAMQLFIEGLSKFITNADAHKVEYVYEPEEMLINQSQSNKDTDVNEQNS